MKLNGHYFQATSSRGRVNSSKSCALCLSFVVFGWERRIDRFDDPEAVAEFLGEREDPFDALDPDRPVTFGPYMNDPDLINNKVQQHEAMEAAQ